MTAFARLALIGFVFFAFVLWTAAAGAGDPEFLRGDVNGDGRVTPLLDAAALLTFAFADGPEPPCLDAADVNNNGLLFGLLDSLYLLNWSFGGGPAPPDPGPDACGPDPGGADLSCDIAPDPCPADPLDLEPDPDYALALSDETGVVGGLATVTLSLTNNGEALRAWQWRVCHDDTLLFTENGNILFGDATADLAYAYDIITVDDGYWQTVVILSVSGGGDTLEPGEDLAMYEAVYELLDTPGTAVVEFCDLDLDVTPPTPLLITPALEIFEPELDNGSIEILDALFFLEWAFTSGPVPPCLDAGDIDDNGTVFALVDVLFLLGWAFTGGDPPSDPGPDTCGPDPTDDGVDCAEIPVCQ